MLGPVIVVWLFLDNHPGCWVGKEMEDQTGSLETLGGDAGVQERGDDGLYLDGGSGLGSTRTLRAWRWAEQEGRIQDRQLPIKTEAGTLGDEWVWEPRVAFGM